MLAGSVKVSVDVCGHLNVAMPHPLLHVFQAAAVIDEQACTTMAQLMETDMRQTILLEHLCKMVRHIVRGKGRTIRPLEDVVIDFVALAE